MGILGRNPANVHYGQWNPESYLGRMKFLQYGTGCAGECSEVTESTIPHLLKASKSDKRLQSYGHSKITITRHGPKPGCQEAEAQAFSIFEAEAEALTLFKLEAEAKALVMKPKSKPKPGYL